MNITILLAMLVQSGICAPVNFQGQDGSQLTVLVCPITKQVDVSPDDNAPQGEPREERAL